MYMHIGITEKADEYNCIRDLNHLAHFDQTCAKESS